MCKHPNLNYESRKDESRKSLHVFFKQAAEEKDNYIVFSSLFIGYIHNSLKHFMKICSFVMRENDLHKYRIKI